MRQFVFVYHGGPQSMTPEEGKAHMEQWTKWVEGLGDAVVDRGLAVGNSKTAGPNGVVDDGGPNPISGITIVQANGMDEAMEMAIISPHIQFGGTIEVAQALEMSM